jgi:serine/threonine-protein kinase
MEFVQGRTLRDIVKAEGQLPVRRAMEIVADVCAALDFSHRNGIIHRDIKPANVMITPQGAVKVMDFGIARAVADDSATRTQTANVIGTAQYLSPEQARGESVDARSDVYSTGCLLYELVTGVPPFQGDSPVAVAYQHVRENPVMPSARNPEIPRVVDSIVMKALAKNQLNRYQSAGDMRQDLQRALANQPVSAEAVMTDAERTQFIARTPPPPIAMRRTDYPSDEQDNRRTGLIWAAVVAALLIVIGVASYLILDLGKGGGTKLVSIPTIVGQTPQAAESAIQNAKLKPRRGADVSGQCADNQAGRKGFVCTVEPVEGTNVQQGSTVTYHLYTPLMVQVPAVVGLAVSDAENRLNQKKLGFITRQVNSGGTAGNVVRQKPAEFTVVAPGFKVTLYVTTGKVRLPDVRGKSLGEAQAKLNQAGFTRIGEGNPVTTTDSSKDGKVAFESPTQGFAYAPGQQITLSLYQFQAPPTSSCPAPTSPATSTAGPTGTPTC